MMEAVNLIIVTFHRNLSSSLSQWLHRAGLNMGFYLMPPAVSNPEGHFEDMRLVDLHERLLRVNGVNWQFHDQTNLESPQQVDLLARYILQRDRTSGDTWGAKDPRTCLFLPAWRQALGKRGRYLVLLRHWSGSVQSLYRRHSQSLAVGEGNARSDAIFWRDPERAARMWLAYHRHILDLLEEERERCLVVTQQSLLAGLPVIERVNARFGMALDETQPSPIRHALSHDRIEGNICDRLTVSLVEELEDVWQRLLKHADYRAESETPLWVEDQPADEQVELLLAAAEEIAPPDTLQSEIPEGSLKEKLNALTQHIHLPLESTYWQERIECEARLEPECWEYLARAQLMRGNFRDAERSLGQVLVCGRVVPYLFHLLGICREAEFDNEAAEHHYRQAISRNDANPVFHVRLSRLWFTLGLFDLAENHLQKALGRHPNEPPLLQALAECIDLQGHTDRAITLLADIENRSPMLERQLASLRMKQAPEQASSVQSTLGRQTASDSSVQLCVLQALSEVDEPTSRRDLARRIALVWESMGVKLKIPPEALRSDRRKRSLIHRFSSFISNRS